MMIKGIITMFLIGLISIHLRFMCCDPCYITVTLFNFAYLYLFISIVRRRILTPFKIYHKDWYFIKHLLLIFMITWFMNIFRIVVFYTTFDDPTLKLITGYTIIEIAIFMIIAENTINFTSLFIYRGWCLPISLVTVLMSYASYQLFKIRSLKKFDFKITYIYKLI